MPRWIEWIIAFLLWVTLSPLLLLILIAIVIDSPGWPFFRQRRVGIHGHYFWMLKFRKMHASVPAEGKGITTQNDVRLTRVGRLLERFKLDELPQLINVLRGDMALVGPRPEIPRFTAYYPEKWNLVLQVRPGIVGYSQIMTPHENDLYPSTCIDHEKYYIENILPSKLDQEIQYIQKKGLGLDFSILFRVAISLCSKTITRKWILVRLSHLFLFVSDLVVSELSMMISFFLVFQNGVPPSIYSFVQNVLWFCLLIRPIVFLFFGLHKNPISSTITLNYLLQIVKASFYSSIFLIMTLMFLDERDLILSAHLVDFFVLPFLLTGSRVVYIFVHDSLLKAGSLESIPRAVMHAVIILCFGLVGFVTFWLSHILWLHEFNINVLIPRLGQISLFVFAIRCALSVFVWPPKSRTWRSFWGRDLMNVVTISLIGTSFILVVYLALQEPRYSRFALLCDLIFNICFSAIIMMLWSMPRIMDSQKKVVKKILILGIGVETDLLVSTFQRIDSDYWKIIGIITDIDWKRYAQVSGIRVIGTISDLSSVFELHHPDILITWEWIKNSGVYPYIQEICEEYQVNIAISPSLNTLLSPEPSEENLRLF